MTALATAPSFTLVPFRGTEILAARTGPDVHVPMKPFCETIGIDWPPQARRIKRDQVLAEGVTMMVTPSAGGDQEQVALPLKLIPGFLFGLDARRFAPALQETVHAWRAECFAVLYDHFFGRREPAPLVPVVAPVGWEERAALRRSTASVIRLVTDETRPSVRRLLWQQLDEDCRRLGLDTPPLDELGEDATPAQAIAALLEGCRVLTARRVKWNHAAPRGYDWPRVALNLPELARAFARADVDVAIDADLRAALRSCTTHRVRRATITSAWTGKATHCTILEPVA